jgi:hypothetical protein
LIIPLGALVLSSIMLVAGLMMKRLAGYGLAIAGAILAILVTPGNLIGLPIGIWALVVLSRREVREAFGKGLPMPGQPSRGGGGWKVAAVIVAAQIEEQVPAFLVRGTVTDAVTGRPISGARVDDNAYGARPNRPPQQAWTDEQGHYELRTWYEEHTLAASAPGHETKLHTFTTGNLQQEDSAQVDFQLQPSETSEQTASSPELQALDESVKRGSEAWSSGDFSKALGLLLPAALKGHPVAQHRIGVMYVLGHGVGEDLAEATRWFRKAAEQGQGESQYSLGLRYQLGQSVVQDNKEAARWFKLAADQGIGAAAAALARQYIAGEGVSEDLVEAYKWAAVAAKQPDPNNGDSTLTELGGRLSPDQLAEAQRRAKEFVPKRTAPADP